MAAFANIPSCDIASMPTNKVGNMCSSRFISRVLLISMVYVHLSLLAESRVVRDTARCPSNYSDPSDIATRVANKILYDKEIFFVWDYGGALIFDGLQQVTDAFGHNFTTVTYTYLDDFKTEPWANGYKILHNEDVPDGEAIGDGLGLFPIAYLARISALNSNRNDTDWTIVQFVVKSVFHWPKRLSDASHTISRDTGWVGEPKVGANFLWADDQYMGLVLLARYARVTMDTQLAAYVTDQALSFSRYLVDQSDGLYYHGYSYSDDRRSCCKWGRANGWAMLAHAEILNMLEVLSSERISLRTDAILKEFQRHSGALLKHQSHDGRFRQIINETSTFLETSATAMIVAAWARAVRHGWISVTTYDAAIWRAWRGLTSCVDENGAVTGICIGTGIQTTLAQYELRPCIYELSGDGGLGAVLQAAVQMSKYMTWAKQR